MNIKITKRQQKIFTVVSVIIAVFLIFITFIYLPMRRELTILKKEYGKIESETKEARIIAGEGRSLEDAIGALKTRIDSMNKQFPSKEEGILRALSERAESFKIKVTNMNPEKKRIVQEIGVAPVNIRDCVVQEMALTMNLKTDFMTFGRFARSLKEDFPVWIKMDSVRMESASGDKEKHPLLNIEVKMRAYLICPR